MFTTEDKELLKNKGISKEQVKRQLDKFKKRFPSLKITSIATIGKGILKLTENEMEAFVKMYDKSNVEILKFVPASGAATRMFNFLYKFLEEFDGTEKALSLARKNETLSLFFDHLDQFAFYNELNSKYVEVKGKTIQKDISNLKHNLIVDFLVNSEGMNYGNLPKGLISFHNYGSSVRTAVGEQIYEGLGYAQKNNEVRIHFTTSPNHLEKFEKHIFDLKKNRTKEKSINVSFSSQNESTDTIAVTLDFKPFRNDEGKLLFRPAGHGALLENLNELLADLIFIKNIDNVVPDCLKQETIKFKKALVGVLLKYQEKSFELLRKNLSGEDVLEEVIELLKEMGISGNLSKQEAIELLDRPIRVCGMVKNKGEPGGGPFWVNYGKWSSLQIVESAQIDENDEEQLSLFQSGTHFNPVDLVCGVKNYRGEKFDLLKYRDENAGFISEKSYNGEKLLTMELPGLWNGGMAFWNTIFVEVPVTTFNPVKTITDLLKPAHR